MGSAGTARGRAEASRLRSITMLLQRDHEKTVSQVRGSQQIVAARPGSASRTSNGVPSAESWKRSQVINAARGGLIVRRFSSAA